MLYDSWASGATSNVWKTQFSTKQESSFIGQGKNKLRRPPGRGGGGQSLITMTGSIEVGTTSVSEGWAGRDSKKNTPPVQRETRTFLENKFNDGVKTGVKANPDNVSKEMRQLKDQNGKRVFTVVEFLCPQQISSFFSRMASKRKGAT